MLWQTTNIFQFQTDLFFQMISPRVLGKKGRREGCGHWKENPFLPTRFMHHPTKKEGCTNFSLSVAVICFYDDGKSISTIKLFPCFFSRFLVLSLWILLQQPLATKLDATCCSKVTMNMSKDFTTFTIVFCIIIRIFWQSQLLFSSEDLEEFY